VAEGKPLWREASIMRKKSTLLLSTLVIASLATMGLQCPGNPLIEVSFTGAPTQGQAPLNVHFEGDVTVSPPLVLATKFRDVPDDDEPLPIPEEEDRDHPPVFVILWLWDFGDGATDEGQVVDHIYTDPGCYTVKLTVILSNGMSSSTQKVDFVCLDNPNQPPVADAGPDQTVFLQFPQGDRKGFLNPAHVILDGSGSSDPDNDPLTFQWQFTSTPKGSTAQLSDPTAENPEFDADVAGDYVVELVVDDGHAAKVESAPDTVTITAEAPVG
jgi:PKD repeat protein